MSNAEHKPAHFYYLVVDARVKFNTCRFADCKQQVIDLLKRVSTVSVGRWRTLGGGQSGKVGSSYWSI